MKIPETEICAYTLASCEAACRSGAARVELCASPAEGGTTPSAAAIEMARNIPVPELCVLIRPRSGDFLYSDLEFTQMKRDILFAREHGADGVSLGILTADGQVDIRRTALLVAEAAPMEVTFHRAFDMTRDLFEALEAVIDAGCRRILTSGGYDTAPEAIETLKALVNQAAGRIEIMAGSGIRPENARAIADTGVDALHFSARKTYASGMRYKKNGISMGGNDLVPEYGHYETDPEIARAIIKQLIL